MEASYGYCRAIRAGAHVWIAGTASYTTDGVVAHPGDAYLQAKRCTEIMARALEKLGASLSHVTRTRAYVTDIAHAEAVGKAHREVFGAHPPVTTLIAVNRLLDPDLLVELEADAFIP
ncbi:MAG: RidA family protein [Cyanobacteria bacterium REEB65]|nr:RidA family protein [Cyanobacteria bacterium REEB65]